MLSRPVSSPEKPVPTSNSDETRPSISIRPQVGSVMRERILRNVLLPAPLRPISPSTSHCLTSNDKSFSAQKVSDATACSADSIDPEFLDAWFEVSRPNRD